MLLIEFFAVIAALIGITAGIVACRRKKANHS